MASQTKAVAGSREGASAGDMAPTYGLRNSCDLCHSSKLRCSREKPACARCRKFGNSCTYSPTKRPGRPRKVGQGAKTDSSCSTNTELVVTRMEDTRSDQTSPSSGHMLTPSTYLSSNSLSTAPLWDGSNAALDEVFDQCISVLDSIDTPIMTDTDLLNADPLATPINRTNLHMPMNDVTHTSNEDWLALESIGEGFNRPDHPTVPGSSSQNSDKSSSPDSPWLPDPAQFSDECISLKQWISTSRSLMLFSDASEQVEIDNQCLCHTAVANLQFHRKSVCNIRPELILEACLHLQRLLFWTWSIQKECQSCRDDDLVKLIVAGIINQIVGIYRTIIDDNAKRRHEYGHTRSVSSLSTHHHHHHHHHLPSGPRMQQTMRRSLFDWTSLSFGSKTIHGPAKIAFLRRLIGLKLRQIGRLLEELLDKKHAEPSKVLAQPLRLLVSGTLERVNVTTGMLSTLE